MTFIAGAGIGVVGNVIYQLVSINEFRRSHRFWPWQDSEVGADMSAFLFSILVKLVAAFVVVGALASTKQISGLWAAGIAGMVPDLIVIKAADSAEKKYK